MKIEWEARQILAKGATQTTKIYRLVDKFSENKNVNLIRINPFDPNVASIRTNRLMTKIQALVRGFLVRRKYNKLVALFNLTQQNLVFQVKVFFRAKKTIITVTNTSKLSNLIFKRFGMLPVN
jgi:superfamily II DNA/RNA helicase